MNSRKSLSNLRLQVLTNTIGDIDSPLKRRTAINTSVPATPVLDSPKSACNDDEAERRTSRRFEYESFNESSANLKQESETLTTCLKLYAENKICKENAWTVSIIDSFSKLINKHHHTLSNFQVAGSTLEASTKVYSLRVDSVYTDVIRMNADLSRQTAKALTKGSNKNNDDDDPEQDDDNNKENQNASNLEDAPGPKSKTKKKRRILSTVTKNPESLNARLDTHPQTDPFFAKLNSMVGDVNSSKRLMQNIISTKNSQLNLKQKLGFWDVNDATEIDLKETINYLQPNAGIRAVKFSPMPGISNRLVIRTTLQNYQICNVPFEENEDDADCSMTMRNCGANLSHNASQAELQFDINATVEPIPNETPMVMDLGDMCQEDFEDFNDLDMVAVNRLKGLKRHPIIIEDMQPETSSTLEYSYRPLDMIDRLWAGPSHWKFRQSRRIQSSIGARMSSHLTEENVASAGQKVKATRKRKIVKVSSGVSIEMILSFDGINTAIPFTQKVKGTQLTTQTFTKKWDSKKLKLPIDYKVTSDINDKFIHAPNIHVRTNVDGTIAEDNDDEAAYDYDNENDRNYCSRVDNQSDTEFDNNEFVPPDLVDMIPDFLEGAPNKIETVNIAFAKSAKTIDMKQLKSCSWLIINNKHNEHPQSEVKFSDVLNDLPRILNSTMTENISMPLAFYATLHLCNDKGLLLNRNHESFEDFDIQFVHALVL